jgi:hypothetical protein
MTNLSMSCIRLSLLMREYGVDSKGSPHLRALNELHNPNQLTNLVRKYVVS